MKVTVQRVVSLNEAYRIETYEVIVDKSETDDKYTVEYLAKEKVDEFIVNYSEGDDVELINSEIDVHASEFLDYEILKIEEKNGRK